MTTIEEVRLLIPDLDSEFDEAPVFTDDQIEIFIALNGDNPFLAAAAALEVIAVNEALVFRYVKTNDLVVDGARSAAVLLERAKTLRASTLFGELDTFITVYPVDRLPITPEAAARALWP